MYVQLYGIENIGRTAAGYVNNEHLPSNITQQHHSSWDNHMLQHTLGSPVKYLHHFERECEGPAAPLWHTFSEPVAAFVLHLFLYRQVWLVRKLMQEGENLEWSPIAGYVLLTPSWDTL